MKRIVSAKLIDYINNKLFKTLPPKDWELLEVLYIASNEKDSHI
jgi:hypothetical protein